MKRDLQLTRAEPDEVPTEEEENRQFSEGGGGEEEVGGTQSLLDQYLPLLQLARALLCPHNVQLRDSLHTGWQQEIIKTLGESLQSNLHYNFIDFSVTYI